MHAAHLALAASSLGLLVSLTGGPERGPVLDMRGHGEHGATSAARDVACRQRDGQPLALPTSCFTFSSRSRMSIGLGR
jgi:hypothetical protein